MCESKAVVLEDGREETIMDEVAFLYFRDGNPVVKDVIGNETVLEGYDVESVDFLRHVVRFRIRRGG